MSAGSDRTDPGIQDDPTIDRPDDDDAQAYTVRTEGFEASEGLDGDVVSYGENEEDADEDVQGYTVRSQGFEASQGTEDDAEGQA